REELRLRRIDGKGVDHGQPAFAMQLRQDRRDARAIHLAVDLLREILVRQAREDLAAAAPQRVVGLARARAARALLRPRLLVRLVDVGTALLLARAAPGIRLVGRDELVDQRLVVVAAEQRVRARDRRGRL